MTSVCQRDFGVTFPLSQKIAVNGTETDPVFQYLKKAVPNGLFGKRIKRNFTKFLIDTQGNVFGRYAPTRSPLHIESDIIELLSS